jgi:hypothetical protein
MTDLISSVTNRNYDELHRLVTKTTAPPTLCEAAGALRQALLLADEKAVKLLLKYGPKNIEYYAVEGISCWEFSKTLVDHLHLFEILCRHKVLRQVETVLDCPRNSFFARSELW